MSLLKKTDSKNQKIKTGYPPTIIIPQEHLFKHNAMKSKKE